jgi:prefoldin subunit 5
MALGMEKIKKVLELINQIKEQMVDLRDRMQKLETTINDVDDRLAGVESSVHRQEELLSNLAEQEGLEVEANGDEEKK